MLLALDGHSACANMIQEAKNGKFRAAIFADARNMSIRKKASSLGGYVRLFRDGREIEEEAMGVIQAQASHFTQDDQTHP